MELEEKSTEKEAFKKIIFEKIIYPSVCDFLKNYKKIYVITSPTPKEKYLQFFINTLNENKITHWVNILNSHAVCDNYTILKSSAKVRTADLIVSFGGGTVADITKITAKNFNLPYCVIPTTITHYGIFNNVAYLLDNGFPKLIKTNYPEKVFIDESIIKNSPEKFILSSLCFSISLAENLFVLELKKRILGECNIDILSLKNKLHKIEELLNWITISKDFALLNLMDYIIDLNELCKGCYETNSIFYSIILNSSTLKNNFGEKCLLTSSILMNLYNSFFNQNKVYIKNIPNREKIINSYTKVAKNNDFFDSYIKDTQILLDNNLNTNINVKKVDLLNILKFYKSIISKFSKKVLLINNNSSKLRMIDENELYLSLEILPYIHDSFILNIITRYGYLNVS